MRSINSASLVFTSGKRHPLGAPAQAGGGMPDIPFVLPWFHPPYNVVVVV